MALPAIGQCLGSVNQDVGFQKRAGGLEYVLSGGGAERALAQLHSPMMLQHLGDRVFNDLGLVAGAFPENGRLPVPPLDSTDPP